jgi:uncharacterized membrane protein YqaE (UPF0057 family)
MLINICLGMLAFVMFGDIGVRNFLDIIFLCTLSYFSGILNFILLKGEL